MTVAIPSLGLLMVLCCRVLTNAATLDTVERYQKYLRAISVMMLLCIGGLLTIALIDQLNASPGWDFVLLGWQLLRIAVMVILFIVANVAWKIGSSPVELRPSVSKLAIRSRQLKWLWVGSLFVTALPVLIFGLAPLVYLWVLTSVDFAYQNLIVRVRRSRLLWALAIGTRVQKPLHLEILQLAKSEDDRQQAKLLRLAASLEEGNSLSRALASVPGLLPVDVISVVSAAEGTSQLPEALLTLARQQSHRWGRDFSLEENINGLMLYTVACLSLCTVVISFVMYYIIPKFKAIMNDFGVDASPSFLLLLGLSDFFTSYWFLTLPLIPAALLALYLLMLICDGYDGRYMKRLNSLWPRLQAPRLLRSLAIAIRANAQPDDVLSAYAFSEKPTLEHQRLQRVQMRLASGETLGGALFDEGYLNQREYKAIDVAAGRGHLAWALDSIARRIELSRYNRTRWILEFARPTIILLLGVIVLLFCVAILSLFVKVVGDLA